MISPGFTLTMRSEQICAKPPLRSKSIPGPPTIRK